MSNTMKKIGKVLVAAAGIAAAGIFVKKWLDGKKELRDISEDEDIFEEEDRSEKVLVEKVFGQAKTVELSGEISDMRIFAAASSVTYDLSEGVLSDDRIIEVQAVCANVRIECPIGVQVQMIGEGKLSNLLCNAPIPEEENTPCLYIHVKGFASAVLAK